MANITLAVDTNLRHDMDVLTGVVWSDVAAEAALDKAKREETLKRLDKLLRNSKLTDEDIAELSRAVKKSRRGRYEELKSEGLI